MKTERKKSCMMSGIKMATFHDVGRTLKKEIFSSMHIFNDYSQPNNEVKILNIKVKIVKVRYFTGMIL